MVNMTTGALYKDLHLAQKPWADYVEHDILELLDQSLHLITTVSGWQEKFHDYSFVVFPAAKAYEGFLKKLFFDLHLISKDDYYYKHFRIGKALNPALEGSIRKKESVYDRLVEYCHGPNLADELWETWVVCRNSIFHWFPEEKTVIDFDEAKKRVNMIINAFDLAYQSCKI